MKWEEYRAQFPGLSRYTYLNTAASGVVSVRAAGAARRYYTDASHHGGVPAERWEAQVARARAHVAAMLGVTPDEVAFVPSTSLAMNFIAQMLAREGRGSVAACELEFPSSTLPFLNAGFSVRWVKAKDGLVRAEDYAAALGKGVRAIVASVTQYSSGCRLDPAALGRVAKEAGCRLVLNLTQAAGSFGVDLRATGADFAAFTGVKWLCAGDGTAAMYVRRDLLEEFPPPVFGWRSVADPYAMDNTETRPRPTADRFEVGGMPLAQIFALGAAARLYATAGRRNVEARTLSLSGLLSGLLRRRGFSLFSPTAPETARSGIVTFRVRGAASLVEALMRRRVNVSCRGGMIRASVHYYNTEEEVERLMWAMDKEGAEPV